MRYLAAAFVFLLTVSFTAQETITTPYNPDFDSDSYVGITDLIELLSIYSYYFEAGEIMVNDTTLSSYLNDLTLLLEAAALPEGTSDGQFLKWNGSDWVLVMPVAGCTDPESCSYDSTSHVHLQNLCIYPDACGVCDGPGEIYGCGCSEIPEGDCDCDGNQVDALNVCGGSCSEDLDEDGICDDGDSCIGEADECGVCNGPGAIYDCGCTEPAPDTCDCEGNVVDAVGVCGGGCQEDVDADGICDSQDECVGEFDDCGVCNGPGPILGCGCENIPEGDCDCQGNQLDAVGTCGGACQTDVNGDGVCDDDSIPGCTYDAACNYDPSASINDGSCDFTSCYGCTDSAACNYSAAAYIDNQSCWYASFALDCEYNCLNDSDGDGYCDELEIYGCTDTEACNYEAGATELDDSCTYPGCTYSTSCNFNPEAGCDDGSCVEEGDAGCIDSIACNFDETALCGDNSCTYEGCTNPLASNFNETAGCDDGSCIVYGCMVDLACNYEPTANIDDDSCEFGNCPGCNDSGALNYNPTSTNNEICAYCNDELLYEGFTYNTEEVAGLCWIVENLRYIPEVVPYNENSCGYPQVKVWGYGGFDEMEAQNYMINEGSNVYYSSEFVLNDINVCPTGYRIPTESEIVSLSFSNFELAEGYLECNGNVNNSEQNYYWHTTGTSSIFSSYIDGSYWSDDGYSQYEMLIKCVRD